MLRSYFRFGLRHLVKSKGYSIINVLGLVIGLSCCLGIGLFVHDELTYDHFHRNLFNIYRVVEKQKQAGVMYDVASTPGPLGPAMKKDLTGVIEACRIGRTSGFIEVGEIVVEPEHMRLVDNSFFSMFDFKLSLGNPSTALKHPDEIVLSETTTAQLFGSDWKKKSNVLGTMLKASTWGREKVFTITGVVEDAPHNSHIRFSTLISFENADDFNWDNNSYQTYILVDPSTDVAALDKKLKKYLDQYSQYNSKDDARTLLLQPMKDVYLRSHFDFNTDSAVTSNLIYTQIFIAVGLMVLLIAVFNFVNLSTARATHRAKDVGIRKVVGALYKQLVAQFLVESFILTTLAVIIALGLLQVFIPLLNTISGKSLVVPFHSPMFIAIVALSTLVISTLAGLYPAFYLSKFAPAKVLKGSIKIRSGITFRRMLVVGQFAFSVVLVIGSIVIYQQLRYIQEKDLGFDREQLIQISLRNKMSRQGMLLKEELKNESSIASVAPVSGMLVNLTNSTYGFEWEGQAPDDKVLITQVNTDADLMRTLGLKLVAGRNFYMGEMDSSSYIINETAAKRMGWSTTEAVGKSVTLWGKQGFVIGVVKDFHFQDMTTAIEPFIFRSWVKSDYNGVLVKTQPGRVREAIAVIEQKYKAHDEKGTLHYEFMDDALDRQYRTQQNTGSIILVFSVLAVLVSCLGLFGLATYAAEQRTKEIGIRKVLGASIVNIVTLLSTDFVKLVLISIVIATPVAWWSLNQWLADFAYKISIEWWMFASAGLILIVIALLTVSYHSIKTAILNPVVSLKAE